MSERASETSGTRAMISMSPAPLPSASGAGSGRLALHHHLLDLGDRLGRIEALGAGLGAVHDGVAAIELKGVLEIVEPLGRRLVAAVDQPAIGLQQHRRPQIFLAV